MAIQKIKNGYIGFHERNTLRKGRQRIRKAHYFPLGRNLGVHIKAIFICRTFLTQICNIKYYKVCHKKWSTKKIFPDIFSTIANQSRAAYQAEHVRSAQLECCLSALCRDIPCAAAQAEKTFPLQVSTPTLPWVKWVQPPGASHVLGFHMEIDSISLHFGEMYTEVKIVTSTLVMKLFLVLGEYSQKNLVEYGTISLLNSKESVLFVLFFLQFLSKAGDSQRRLLLAGDLQFLDIRFMVIIQLEMDYQRSTYTKKCPPETESQKKMHITVHFSSLGGINGKCDRNRGGCYIHCIFLQVCLLWKTFYVSLKMTSDL